MEKLLFADGEKIGLFDGERTKLFESDYIKRYREYAENRTRNDEWKFGGEGARFRGDYDTYRSRKEKIDAWITGVAFDGDKALYSFQVNSSSGVYRKDVVNEKNPEEHIISSSDNAIASIYRAGNTLAVTVENPDGSSSVGTLNCVNSELKTLTDGDSRDANACFSAVNPNELLFDSAGLGRDMNGEFTGKYSPAALLKLDLDSMEIEEILSDKNFSYVKPKQDANGTLYCIQRPAKERRKGNLFLDILLIPFRILQAIVMFVQFFVVAMTGKSLTSDGENPAKGRENHSRKLFVDGNLIEAEKEMKRNKKKKDADYGFIPSSWKLLRISGDKQEVLKSGVCDFALCADGGLYCTNGRRIFYVNENGCKKIADTEKCLSLATENTASRPDDLFGI